MITMISWSSWPCGPSSAHHNSAWLPPNPSIEPRTDVVDWCFLRKVCSAPYGSTEQRALATRRTCQQWTATLIATPHKSSAVQLAQDLQVHVTSEFRHLSPTFSGWLSPRDQGAGVFFVVFDKFELPNGILTSCEEEDPRQAESSRTSPGCWYQSESVTDKRAMQSKRACSSSSLPVPICRTSNGLVCLASGNFRQNHDESPNLQRHVWCRNF